MRIAKYLSAAGICSRRDAEKMVDAGRVRLNGQLLTTPANLVQVGDLVEVDGQLVASSDKVRLWLYHKPPGLVTTHKDEQGRRTVFDEIRKLGLPRVVSVGRLDLASEGLLLLTNSGALARKLELPANKFDRVYRVRAFGDPKELLAAGGSFRVEGIQYSFKSLQIERSSLSKNGATNRWYRVVLQEGKNREIRRVFAHFGLQVSRLIRTEYAGYKLGNLSKGEIKELDNV